FLMDHQNFVEKLFSTPGLLFPGSFFYENREESKLEAGVGYELNGRPYTSVIWKLRELDADANKDFFDKQLMTLKRANDQALAVLRDERHDPSEVLRMLPDLELDGFRQYFSELLTDYTHASTGEEKKKARDAALAFAEDLDQRLAPHVAFAERFNTSFYEFIDENGESLLELCKGEYPFLFQGSPQTIPQLPRSRYISSIHMEASFGHLDGVSQMLPFTDPNIVDDQGNTPLMLAAQKGYIPCVKLLLDWKANIHLKNHEGKTALMLAIKAGKMDMVMLLLNAGAKD
ncbi:MAG TPA: ankyrin repeat domain-containing protein, partial [Alphaproteobacteria bacterium]|nr:ankyrin repeat domain-containing protein [Alphaproteobacteria bacterium]